ncbi:hypothetical protein C4580_02595 [Candidatus Woesearchaeota archaeon]|nr:MAG: hypothetical protein C4580_02595 [Candidatus Woesearchaeota archaeon]
MTVSRGVGQVVVPVLGILVLVVAIFAAASLLGSDAPIRPIITKGIELRSAESALDKARLISDLDDLVTQADNEDIKEQWDRMTSCLSTSCPDEAYLDLVLVTVAAYEHELPESALLINLIAVGKYWGESERLLEFSRAMSIANDQIEELESKNARKQWQQIIDCNGTCPEKNDLFFTLVQTIVT